MARENNTRESITPAGDSVGTAIALDGGREAPLFAFLPALEADGDVVRWEVSPDGSTWFDLYDSAGVVEMTVGVASRGLGFPLPAAWGPAWIRPVHYTALGVARAQSAERSILIVPAVL